MPDVRSFWKKPKGAKSKGRARPDEPLGMCEACPVYAEHIQGPAFPAVPHQATERHHVLRRSHGGGDNDTIDVCSWAHAWIHSHPDESYRLGLLRRGVS